MTMIGLKQQALTLLQSNRVPEAVSLLQTVSKSEDTADVHALLGAAYYRQEAYDAAARELTRAVQQDPGNAQLQEMLQQAASNQTAEPQNDVTAHPLDVKQLLGPPRPVSGKVGSSRTRSICPRPGQRGRTSCRRHRGRRRDGRHGDPRAPGQREVWSTWSKENFVNGLMALAKVRHYLNKHNLYSTYPDGVRPVFSRTT